MSILQYLNDRIKIVESNGKKAIRFNSLFDSERAQRGPVTEVLMILLGAGVVGTLAFNLSGIAGDVLPGPEASVNVNQDGTEVFLTIDSMDSNVGNITVDVSGANNNDQYSFGTTNSGGDLTLVSDASSVEVGQTIILDGVEEGDIITVTAIANNSDNTNQVETFEVGPTGA